MAPKKILILGATGSVGTQVLDCLRKATASDFAIMGLVTKSSRAKVESLQKEFLVPRIVVTAEEQNAEATIAQLINDADVVINALAGLAGVEPTRVAVEAGKTILLANKESLVTAGVELIERARKTRARVIPLDSEAAGLWALLRCNHQEHAQGVVPFICPQKSERVQSFIITASGGPFWGFSPEQLSQVTVEDALNHPTWKMGKKISIDSATLMNKAFEVIECQRLFQIPAEKIEVRVDRKSFVHAVLAYTDGTHDLVCYKPDMHVPIADALRAVGVAVEQKNFVFEVMHCVRDLNEFGLLTVSHESVPALPLAYAALAGDDRSCRILCEKNEVAVEQFLLEQIPFTRILSSLK